MDFLFTIISEVGKCLYEPVKRHCGYLFCYARNVEKLSAEVTTLSMVKNDVDNKLEEERRTSQKEPKEAVKQWKKDVENVARQTNVYSGQLISGEQRPIRMGFCCCLDVVTWRYKLGKDAAKEILRVQELTNQLNNFHGDLTYRPPPSNVVIRRSATIQNNESITKSVEGQVKQALGDHSIRSIGIHGMGGIGKTTLVEKINNDMIESNLFNKIIMVTVTQNPDLKRIQGDIADRLGLNNIKDVNTDQHRASLLFDELKNYERVLMILDDVWQKLEMTQVGIPCRDEHPCCKIIIATRHKDVCVQMGMDIKISVEPWSPEDSRKLFVSKVGQDMILKNPKLEPLANEIIKECGGNPLAIVTLASALVGNDTKAIWKDALRSLQSSDPNELESIEGMDTVIRSIKYSYNNLPGDQVHPMKLCFLFCSLFPEDWDINLFVLRTYGIGEGFLRVDGSLLDARGRLESYIERLKARNLLLASPAKNCVRMHDVVRDVARLIASKEHGFIGKARMGLDKWPELLDNAADCKRMSLMNNDIRVLPADNDLNMPELRTLLLTGNQELKKIPDNFFARMNKLVNLDLSGTAVSMLPPSMSCLTSLRTLDASTYRGDGKRDMSLIGKLEKLEMLILGYEILKVPNGLGELTNLKVLHLWHNLESIPEAVIPKLLLLEELCLKSTVGRGPSNSGRSATLAEVASLKHLTTLQLAVKSVGSLSQDIPLCWKNNLQEFIICLGSFNVPWDTNDLSRVLFIENLSRPIKGWVLFLLHKSEDLYVRNNEDFRHFPCLNIMDNLKRLRIRDWAVMENVINIEEDPQAINNLGRLERLHLQELPNLERICYGPLGDELVMNLKELIVRNCEKIQSIIPHDLLQASQSLESLQVTECESLTHVISINVDAPSNIASARKVQLGDQYSTYLLPRDIEKKKIVLFSKEGGVMEREDLFPKLNELTLEDLPNLVSICLPEPIHFGKQQQQSQLRDAFVELNNQRSTAVLQASAPNVGVLLQNLTMIRITSCNSLNNLNTLGSLQKLRQLHITRCDNLTNLFKLSMIEQYGSLHSIRKIIVKYCSRLKWIVVKEEDEDGKEDQLVPLEKGTILSYDHLTFLELKNLPELMSFYSWDTNILVSPSLEQIRVIECENFQIQSILPVDILETSRLISLTSLHVKGCKSLIQVVSINPELPPSIIDSDKAQLGEHSTDGKMKKLSFNNGVLLERGGLFPGLDELILEDLPNLMSICLLQPSKAKYFGKQLKQGLEDASIAENDQMSVMRALAPNLAVFQNLTTLRISECHNLKYLFSLDMFQNGGPQGLKDIDIFDCNNLKWIIVNEEYIEEGEKKGGEGFVSSGLDEEKGSLLCSLIILELRKLPELLSFSNWDDSLLLPSNLAVMTVGGCPKLGERQYHYPPQKESLNDQENQMPPMVLLQKEGYIDLMKLEVWDSCSGGILQHVFSWLDGGVVAGVATASGSNMGTSALNQLESLALTSLPNLSSIIYYGNPPKLPPLERIFLNLGTLEVMDCNRLRHLFPPPHDLTAESSLPHLAILRVHNCEKLVSCVMIKKRDVDKDVPLFATWPKLKELDLSNLPDLLCVYGEEGSSSFLLQQRSLTHVNISGCPKLWKQRINIASSSYCSLLGNSTLINLPSDNSSSAPVTFSLEKLQISGFHQTQHVFSFEEGICTSVFNKLDTLSLQDLPRLESICKGHIPPRSFPNLQYVQVSKCHSLRGCLQFSLILAGSLQHLKSLVVESCEKLEKLITSPDEEAEGQKVAVVLPQLKDLTLTDLPELTSLYGVGDAFLQLPSLEWTTVNNCSKLKQLPFGPNNTPMETNTLVQPFLHVGTSLEKEEEAEENQEEGDGLKTHVEEENGNRKRLKQGHE